jgi:hypothetical protein
MFPAGSFGKQLTSQLKFFFVITIAASLLRFGNMR